MLLGCVITRRSDSAPRVKRRGKGLTFAQCPLHAMHKTEGLVTDFSHPHIDFPGDSVEKKKSVRNVRDSCLNPGSGIAPGEGNSNPLQDSCLENPMDRGAWRATIHRVTKESDMTE